MLATPRVPAKWTLPSQLNLSPLILFPETSVTVTLKFLSTVVRAQNRPLSPHRGEKQEP